MQICGVLQQRLFCRSAAPIWFCGTIWFVTLRTTAFLGGIPELKGSQDDGTLALCIPQESFAVVLPAV
jgi:hypothetical protein